MPLQLSKSSAGFREVFRNRSATEFAPIPLLATVFQLLFGLVFAGLLLVCAVFFILALPHTLFGIDFLDKRAFEDIPEGIKGIIALLVGLLFTVLFFGTMAYWCLRWFRRHLFARLYMLSNKPLHCVEGTPILDPSSESGLSGIEIGEFYFSFEDCWLSVDIGNLEELYAAGGTLRIWYIPAGMRTWLNPNTGKTVRYDCILVRAEWKP